MSINPYNVNPYAPSQLPASAVLPQGKVPVRIAYLSFGSCVKFSAFSWAALGCIAIPLYLIAFLAIPIRPADANSPPIIGMLVGLLFVPVVYGIMGAVFGILIYLPQRWLLGLLGGLKGDGEVLWNPGMGPGGPPGME